MTREEAAARAVAKDEDASNWDEEKPWYQNGWLGRVDTILAAADAHDAANGVHRVTLDDATVDKVAAELALGDDVVPSIDQSPSAYRALVRAV